MQSQMSDRPTSPSLQTLLDLARSEHGLSNADLLTSLTSSAGSSATDWLFHSSEPNSGTINVAATGSLLPATSALPCFDTSGDGADNTASLYVKNLPPETSELFLYQKFAIHGALSSCKVYTDPATGKCRGVGFVNFMDKQAALQAQQQLHGFRIRDGHQMHITLQAPRAVRSAQQRHRQLQQLQQQQALPQLLQQSSLAASQPVLQQLPVQQTPAQPVQYMLQYPVQAVLQQPVQSILQQQPVQYMDRQQLLAALRDMASHHASSGNAVNTRLAATTTMLPSGTSASGLGMN